MRHLVLLAAKSPTLSEWLRDLLKNPVFMATLLTAWVIPFLNGALTRPTTPGWFKSALTFALAGAAAVVMWLNNLGGVVNDWKPALGVFITAVLGAGGVHAAIVKGPVADRLGNVIPINLGPKPMTPEKAVLVHSHGTDLTEPVPADHYAQFATDEVPDEYKTA